MDAWQRILGINFFVGSIDETLSRAMQGGLMVVPAAPALTNDFMHSAEYREAVLKADLVIPDSGFMVLLWQLRTGERLPKHSGLTFLRELMQRGELQQGKKAFWVVSSEHDKQLTYDWLRNQGISTHDSDFYVAPMYGKGMIEDPELIAHIETEKPDMVIIAIGGGVQERLGLTLKQQLSYRPGIFCIGAAVAFLTGGQAHIPVWGDKLFLGWLFRIMYDPKKFWPRYRDAFRLAPILWKYCDTLPPVELN